VRQILVIFLSLIAGFVGGILGTLVFRPSGQPGPANVVRARSFELLNEAGQAISYWGSDDGQNVVLAFGSRPGTVLAEGAARPVKAPHGQHNPENQLAAIGLLANDSPFLQMRGEDGKTRVRLLLSDYAKPTLLMEDETGPRVSLGIEQSDTPGPSDNDWTLAFYPERARIGMFTEKLAGKTYVRGIFLLDRNEVKYP
jgi:hypothetical protein